LLYYFVLSQKNFLLTKNFLIRGWSWNFGGQHPHNAQLVINNWPGKVTFTGNEPGQHIYSGGHLKAQARSDSPVLAAYEWYSGRTLTSLASWDPITVLYGVLGGSDSDLYAALGVRNVFEYANEFGYNRLDANGSNEWINDREVTWQHWLKLADGVSHASVGWLLDRLYAMDPVQTSCLLSAGGSSAANLAGGGYDPRGSEL